MLANGTLIREGTGAHGPVWQKDFEPRIDANWGWVDTDGSGSCYAKGRMGKEGGFGKKMVWRKDEDGLACTIPSGLQAFRASGWMRGFDLALRARRRVPLLASFCPAALAASWSLRNGAAVVG